MRPGQVAAFEAAYGSDGDWARLFRQHPGYLATELLRDGADPLRYCTVDRWVCAEALADFRVRFADAYERLDRACEAFTEHEELVGHFTTGC